MQNALSLIAFKYLTREDGGSSNTLLSRKLSPVFSWNASVPSEWSRSSWDLKPSLTLFKMVEDEKHPSFHLALSIPQVRLCSGWWPSRVSVDVRHCEDGELAVRSSARVVGQVQELSIRKVLILNETRVFNRWPCLCHLEPKRLDTC